MIRVIDLNGHEIEYELEYIDVKNINLRVKPDGTVYVSANRRHSVRKIEAMMYSNSAMILNSLQKFKEARNSIPFPEKYVSGEKISVLGELLELEVRKSSRNLAFTEDRFLVVAVRETENFELKEKTVMQWLKKISSTVISDYCRRYYPQFAQFCIAFPTVKFRKMKSRWGSCNPKENILTFNTGLAYAPRECIEYVVVHEFSHFVYADHSQNFYRAVENILPNWKQRRSMIRKYEFLLM